jgi:hypothetical protein
METNRDVEPKNLQIKMLKIQKNRINERPIRTRRDTQNPRIPRDKTEIKNTKENEMIVKRL